VGVPKKPTGFFVYVRTRVSEPCVTVNMAHLLLTHWDQICALQVTVIIVIITADLWPHVDNKHVLGRSVSLAYRLQ